MNFEQLERRALMDADPNVVVNLLVDADRNGVIDRADNRGEDGWSKAGRGAIVLPNLDRDNTTTSAPDNWTGGVFNGKTVAPNHVIDNAADLADIGRITLRKLKTDASYEYTVVIRILKPASDPAWFSGVAATDRVRLFMPSKVTRNGDTVPQPGDVAVIGPGLGSEIRFTNDPAQPNEYPITDLVGNGNFSFGVEGLKPGANVRIEAELIYQPLGTDGAPPDAVSVGTDVVELKVAPFVLSDNRQGVKNAIVEDDTHFGSNAAVRKTLKDVFGKSLIVSKTADLWQQDGYEIGYVQAPYGAMPVVLELPRALSQFGSDGLNMRKFVRTTLLKAGVGVAIDVAGLKTTGDSSSFGGDIETVFTPGSNAPGRLLVSNMPAQMRSFFAAQDVNAELNLPLDWLSVNHVDEVVQQAPNGKVIVADPDVAWALLVWAQRIDANVRLHPNLNGNDGHPDHTAAGVKASLMLNDARLRHLSLDFAQRSASLRGVVDKLKNTFGLKDELTAPAKTGTGSIKLARGGTFTQMIGTNVVREFAVTFSDATNYRLRYRDNNGTWSKWQAGRTDRDEVFGGARAFILKNYWSGTANAGDSFRFRTRPDANLLKMPVLFATGSLLVDESPTPETPYLLPFSEDHVNALVNGTTVITGAAHGPKVKFSSREPASDLFQHYAGRVFGEAGYTKVLYTDARLYHNSSGSLHCATNTIRDIPGRDWWAN